MEKQLSEKLPRVEVVDALRGFAVMAILLVHSLEHFIFPVYPVDQPAWLNILNDGVFNVTFTLLAGKSYAIFALLFGFTFYIQSANQRNRHPIITGVPINFRHQIRRKHIKQQEDTYRPYFEQ
jgi:uncharacterized protein